MNRFFSILVVLLLVSSCTKKAPVDPAEISLTQKSGCSIKAKEPEECDKTGLKLNEKASSSIEKKSDDFSEFKK